MKKNFGKQLVLFTSLAMVINSGMAYASPGGTYPSINTGGTVAQSVYQNTYEQQNLKLDASGLSDVIVVYKNSQGKSDAMSKSVEVQHEFDSVPAVNVVATNAKIQELKNDPNIAYIEKDIPIRRSVSSDPVIIKKATVDESQWSLQAVNAPVAWADGFTGAGVKVAVVDSGISMHDDLVIAGGISTVSYTTSYADDDGHGTHVAGIIAAQRNDVGMVGVAPGVSLYAVKVLDQTGSGVLSDFLAGMDWAINNHMDIVNMSLGTQTDSQLLHDMMDNARNAGIILVAATGNDGAPDGSGETIDYPANYSSVIGVAAVDNTLTRASFSSTGADVEFAAPGKSIVSTYPFSDPATKVSPSTTSYAGMSGTSQASPHVTGMLAILKQKNPSFTGEQLRTELQKYTQDLGAPGKDPLYGYGTVDYTQLAVKQQAVTDATAAVVNAETAKTQASVDSAKLKVDALPSGQEKTDLQARLDVVQQGINAQVAVDDATAAVVNAETAKTQASVDAAKTKVDALPVGQTKTDLQARLDVVQQGINALVAVDDATSAVVTAETVKTQASVDAAKTKVDALPAGQTKTDLQARLVVVQQAIDDQAALAVTDATNAVTNAESVKTQASVNDAKVKVDALPSGQTKTDLQARLDAVQQAINAQSALDDATSAVVTAETVKTQASVDTAKTKVNALPNGQTKTDLQARIDVVQQAIDAQTAQAALDQAIADANTAVANAESLKTQASVDAAKTKVNALPVGQTKTDLQARLDAVQQAIDAQTAQEQAVTEATADVINAESLKTQASVDVATGKVNALPNGQTKTDLQARLDAVQQFINAQTAQQQAITEATADVVNAESVKTQATVDTAKAKVNALADGQAKTDLLNRLNLVQQAITPVVVPPVEPPVVVPPVVIPPVEPPVVIPPVVIPPVVIPPVVIPPVVVPPVVTPPVVTPPVVTPPVVTPPVVVTGPFGGGGGGGVVPPIVSPDKKVDFKPEIMEHGRATTTESVQQVVQVTNGFQAFAQLKKAEKTNTLKDMVLAESFIGKLQDGSKKDDLGKALQDQKTKLDVTEIKSEEVTSASTMTMDLGRIVDPKSINSDNVFVIHNGVIVKGLKVTVKGTTIVVETSNGVLDLGEYFIYVDSSVKSAENIVIQKAEAKGYEPLSNPFFKKVTNK